MMTHDLIARINGIRQFSYETIHKPLLLLWAVGRCLRHEERLVSFRVLQKDLTDLNHRLGHPRKNFPAQQPFWRLRKDKVWIVENSEKVRETSSGDAFVTDLIAHDIHGGLSQEDYLCLQNNPDIATDVVLTLLDKIGPESIHEDVLSEVGIDDYRITVTRRQRKSEFRERILLTYDSQCAVCEFSIRANQKLLGVEAAHIRWHGRGGPDKVTNGLALCSVHHVLFDRGAFTLRIETPELNNYQVVVAKSVIGQATKNGLLHLTDSHCANCLTIPMTTRIYDILNGTKRKYFYLRTLCSKRFKFVEPYESNPSCICNTSKCTDTYQ